MMEKWTRSAWRFWIVAGLNREHWDVWWVPQKDKPDPNP